MPYNDWSRAMYLERPSKPEFVVFATSWGEEEPVDQLIASVGLQVTSQQLLANFGGLHLTIYGFWYLYPKITELLLDFGEDELLVCWALSKMSWTTWDDPILKVRLSTLSTEELELGLEYLSKHWHRCELTYLPIEHSILDWRTELAKRSTDPASQVRPPFLGDRLRVEPS